MTPLAPDVERLCARLAAAPAVFAAPFAKTAGPAVAIPAVVADLFRDRASRPLSDKELAALKLPAKGASDATKLAKRHLELVLLASWLLHDGAFQGVDADRLYALLTERLKGLAELVVSRAFHEDPDRREELVRVALDALGIAPAGEPPADAEDRLASLDTVRRTRLLREARAREEERERERQRKKLEEMKRQAAEAAAREAAKTSYED